MSKSKVKLGDYRRATSATFELPPDDVRKNLQVRQLVKCVFHFEGCSSERRWVVVTKVGAKGRYVGKLCNTPLELPLTWNDTIRFAWNNVICVGE